MFEKVREQLRFQAAQKRFPEFYAQCQEIERFYHIAQSLHRDGKLSRKELRDFEGSLWEKYQSALPMEMYVDFVNSGAREDVEALAGYDDEDTRSQEGVSRARKDVTNKIKLELMDQAWLEQRIDAKTYAEMYLSEIDASDDGLRDQVHRGKHDHAASEIYARRHDVPVQHMSPAMAKWGKDNGIKSFDEILGEVKRQSRHRADQYDDGYDEDGADKDGFVNIDVLQAREERALFREREAAEAASAAASETAAAESAGAGEGE